MTDSLFWEIDGDFASQGSTFVFFTTEGELFEFDAEGGGKEGSTGEVLEAEHFAGESVGVLDLGSVVADEDSEFETVGERVDGRFLGFRKSVKLVVFRLGGEKVLFEVDCLVSRPKCDTQDSGEGKKSGHHGLSRHEASNQENEGGCYSDPKQAT